MGHKPSKNPKPKTQKKKMNFSSSSPLKNYHNTTSSLKDISPGDPQAVDYCYQTCLPPISTANDDNQSGNGDEIRRRDEDAPWYVDLLRFFFLCDMCRERETLPTEKSILGRD